MNKTRRRKQRARRKHSTIFFDLEIYDETYPLNPLQIPAVLPAAFIGVIKMKNKEKLNEMYGKVET